MINDNKKDFMNAVSIEAEDFRSRAFAASIENFVKSIVKEATIIEVPKGATLEVKAKIASEVKATIDAIGKEISNNAINNDYEELYNVDIAKEIVNPKSFNESIQKIIAEGVYDEAEERAQLLAIQFDNNKFAGANFDDVHAHVKKTFASEAFDSRFDIGVNVREQIKCILSVEGESIVEEIKNEVTTLVEETEEKNNVVREAVTEITALKEEIEDRINGEDGGGDIEDDNSGDDGELGGEESELDDMGGNPEQSGEVLASATTFKEQKEIRNELAKEDLYQIFQGTNLSNNYSKETFNSAFDRDSFSREAAEEILDNFRELDDGIDTDDVPETEDTLSVGENIEPDDTDEDNSDIESTEKTYVDDEDEYIEVDESAFQYDEPIEKEELSEESMARDILPLSYKKIYGNDIKISKKLPIYLALTHGRGTEFFNYIRNRRIHMENLLSKESTAIVDGIPKEDIEKRLDNVTDIVGKIEADVETLTEDFSIIGILEGKFQRTDDKIQNALTSVFKPGVLKNKTESMSKEELYEHELADIFKLGLQIAEVTNDITDGIDVSGNKDQLGYLEELLNEKMFEIPEVDKFEVETKIKALQSIESVVDIKDVVDMQAFIAGKEAVKVDKVRLDSIKDIDAYGFSYVDEITKIKANLKEKLADRFIETNRVKYNVDIDKIVDLVVEEVDTTKTYSNLYEGVISKLVENKDITSSVEGLIIKNKSKVLTTGYIAGDKLGMLTKDDIQDIRNHLI